MIELADKLLVIAPPLLLVTGLVALVLTLALPRRRIAPLVALALILSAEIWWLVFYAQGLDDYFQGGTTRWEFAASNRQWVVAAVAVASTSVALLLISAFALERDYLARIALLSASASSFMLVFGWFVLTVGH